MGRKSGSVRDDERGAIIDWVVLGAGVLLLVVMVIHDVYTGARESLWANDPAVEQQTVRMNARQEESSS